ncbi:MAG: hypothetical protein AM1032_000093 [Mycoplasmataceae bacterium]|nr:MAG: hypothetical protein AM1032_000093 [Mycoplasmataceae bacterium]
MENYKYLSIDPSGSGTTGMFFYDSETKEELFTNFKSKIWKEHFVFIKNFCEEYKVDYIIYETTNFIKVKGYDLTSLFKMFGIIESLIYMFPIKKCETVLVREVKLSYKKLKENNLSIDNLFFKAGRGGGWFRNNKKIEIHELDAFLIFYCHLKKLDKDSLT